MAQSLSNVLIHIVFSTKERRPWIRPEIDPHLHAYVASICNDLDCFAHKVGGTDDHLHIACSLARTITISKLVGSIKANSSRWLKSQDEAYSTFAWQNGYGAFSVGQSQLESLRHYIATQREHHRQQSFVDEFRALLQRYQVRYDEQFVWD